MYGGSAAVHIDSSALNVQEPGARPRAVEFFSGIGAFAQAAGHAGVEVVAAFDQGQAANRAYEHNYGRLPISRNLDTISAGEVPAAAIWWMSPPCTPFSVRGRRMDDRDPRAASFINLIRLAGERRPATMFVENVEGFAGSRVHSMLMEMLSACSYNVRQYRLCPTLFGVPMRRPRLFVVAQREREPAADFPAACLRLPLADFLEDKPDPALIVEPPVLERYQAGFDVVDPRRAEAYLTCFTSGYWRCMKASGSLLVMPDRRVRRVSPEEILRLLGFSEEFRFPPDIGRQTRWRLAGNSVDVRAVRFCLSAAGVGG